MKKKTEYYKVIKGRTVKMSQQLRAITALAEDLN